MADQSVKNDRTVEVHDVIVVGAGFAGLYAVQKLRNEMGLNVQGFDAASDLGGVWYWNRYPGARCDIQSYVYAYSFSPELEQEWAWTERFAGQPEILNYLNHVADRLDLRRSFHFDTRITSMEWLEGLGLWEVTTEAGQRTRAQFVIAGVGNLSAPREPNFEGMERFTGAIYNTATWPHHQVNLEGKRVAVIGTGASGVQFAAEIAKVAEQLTVFQRTANWCTPIGNRSLSVADDRAAKVGYADLRALTHRNANGQDYEDMRPSALDDDDQERLRRFEEKYHAGGMALWVDSYADILVDARANDLVGAYVADKIRQRVKDPKVAEMLIPRSHRYGTRRTPLETGYYETFNRENVSLIDLNNTPIEEIIETGIRTSSQNLDFDVIVFALGFESMTGALVKLGIRGRKGQTLASKWARRTETFLGISAHGFPNLFMITGPQSPNVLHSMVQVIQEHVDWAAAAIDYARSNKFQFMEADETAESMWVAHNDEIAATTLLANTSSTYMGSGISGRTELQAQCYFGGGPAYRELCGAVSSNGYVGFIFDGKAPTIPAHETIGSLLRGELPNTSASTNIFTQAGKA